MFAHFFISQRIKKIKMTSEDETGRQKPTEIEEALSTETTKRERRESLLPSKKKLGFFTKI